VEGTVREVKRRVRVVASSYRAIDRSVTRWIVPVTTVEWVQIPPIFSLAQSWTRVGLTHRSGPVGSDSVGSENLKILASQVGSMKF